jgi:ribosomal 50S subunit-associated protein YjgA (DUF615 family)
MSARSASCRCCSLVARTAADIVFTDGSIATVVYLAALEFWRVQLLADAVQQHLQLHPQRRLLVMIKR